MLSDASAGRIVYAYSNVDVSAASFAVQLLMYFLFALLLALVWSAWSGYAVARQQALESERGATGIDAAFDPERLRRLSQSLIEWQVSFVVLSIGFAIYTAIFWKQIIRVGDLRLLPEAILVHCLWWISGAIIGLPFLVAWSAWRVDRLRAVSELIHASGPQAEHLDSKLSALRELRPVGAWNAAAIVATFLSALATPLAQMTVKAFSEN